MLIPVTAKSLRKRRSIVTVVLLLIFLIFSIAVTIQEDRAVDPNVLSYADVQGDLAVDALDELEVKGRASKSGYSRSEFSDGWAQTMSCDLRNLILQRDLVNTKLSDDNCVVLNGILDDPYTGKTIEFTRGSTTSGDVQIDHVVALSDAWQKGAQQISDSDRYLFSNDPLNLLAVDGPTNQKKGNNDAASWLPSNKSYRCRYVARQIAVKRKYKLWVTEAEKSAMGRVLNSCRGQILPIESD